MLICYKRGQTSVVLRLKILDSAVTTGAGKTGLAYGTSGLVISTIANNEASATTYTAAGGTIEDISALGTYAAPTATKCRFKEVDSTNHKGLYEIQLADARFAVANAKSLVVSISGASGAAETDVLIPLQDFDPYDAVRAGLTALPNVASGSAGAIVTAGTGTAQISVSSGLVKLDGTQALSAARNVGAVADTSLTVNDAFHCAIAAAAGQETVVGTTYTVKTPSTATTIRAFTLDSGSAPTSRT